MYKIFIIYSKLNRRVFLIITDPFPRGLFIKETFPFNLKYLITILIYFNNIYSFLSSVGFDFYNMYSVVKFRSQLLKQIFSMCCLQNFFI
jgi:hypothetical protein